MVGRFEDSVVFEFFENVFVDIELLGFVDIDFADEWSEVAEGGFFDFFGSSWCWSGIDSLFDYGRLFCGRGCVSLEIVDFWDIHGFKWGDWLSGWCSWHFNLWLRERSDWFAEFAIVAFSGATHDVACDGVYMDELNAQDQAKYIGWQGAFYNVAKIVGTGLLVYLAGFLKDRYDGSAEDAVLYSWTVIMIVLGAVMFALGLYHTRMLPSGKHARSVTSFSQSMAELWNVIRNFFTKKHIVYYIFFIILYRFAEGFVMKIVPLFLKAGREVGGLGLTEQEIGIYYGTFGAAAFVLGSLLGGYYISARGLKKTLFSLCCVFNLPFMAYTLLAIFQPQSAPLIGGAIVLEYFGYGFGFVGLTLFMMQQVAAGPHQMAHYAFASGIMNLGVMLPGMMSGYVSDWLGYKLFFIFVLVATLPAFLMTWFVPFTHEDKR